MYKILTLIQMCKGKLKKIKNSYSNLKILLFKHFRGYDNQLVVQEYHLVADGYSCVTCRALEMFIG